MKAVQVTAYNEPPVLVDVPDPEITGPLDVIVKVVRVWLAHCRRAARPPSIRCLRATLALSEGPCRP